jgi:CRISPR/Cas system CMR subunit Cmr4 (Cas7 group RAMP superfamily)
MTQYWLSIYLRSEATFGRGDGVAGLLDQEVEHDAYGFPYLRGRTLKGVLSEECDNIVAMLPDTNLVDWNAALVRLFGTSGSTRDTMANWHFGDACIPESLRQAVAQQLDKDDADDATDDEEPPLEFTSNDILESLTTIRRQTSINAETGTPEDGSLRSMRVVIRGLVLVSQITVMAHPERDEPSVDACLLAAGCLALRHIGAGRNRGRGWVSCSLHDADGRNITEHMFDAFQKQTRLTQQHKEEL